MPLKNMFVLIAVTNFLVFVVHAYVAVTKGSLDSILTASLFLLTTIMWCVSAFILSKKQVKQS